MGVLNLWKILQPTHQVVSITEDIKNKTLAVDLSIWICENSNIGYYASNTKPYLRTLFFRSKTLLENGCKLIFIREGDVISLKQDTMKKRNQNRFGEHSQSQASQTNSYSQTQSQRPIKNRSRFDLVADECCELLKCMGITVIRSPCGEAEKACAFLNLVGKCDGVLTNDSDVFLYGARCVYRNFNTTDKKGADAIEKYDIDVIEKTLSYDREMLVVLALLLGCDYDSKGVPGCGKEMACKFLNEISELKRNSSRRIDIFDILRKWSSNTIKTYSKTEEKIKKLALSNAEKEKLKFPNEEIIQEYMTFTKISQIILTEEKYLSIKWMRPNLKDFQIFNQNEQNWPWDYSAKKLIPLLILYEYIHSNNENRSIMPKQINKIRRKDSIEYYEVTWFKMVSEDDTDLSDLNEYLTFEKIDLFGKNFPKLVEDYQKQIEEKKNSRKHKKKVEKIKNIEEEEDFGMDSLMELYEEFALIQTQSNKSKNTVDVDVDTQVVSSQISTQSYKKIKAKEHSSNFDNDSNTYDLSSQILPTQSLKKPQKKRIAKPIIKDEIPIQEDFEPLKTLNENEIKQSRSYRLADIIELSDDEFKIENENPEPKKLVDETIILDSEDDIENEIQIIKEIEPSQTNSNSDLDILLQKFDTIKIEEKPINKESTFKKSKPILDESYLPLSQRMKKKFGLSANF